MVLLLDSLDDAHGGDFSSCGSSFLLVFRLETLLGGLLKTSVDFKCGNFQPYLPEDMQVNSYVYGAELAYWLSEKLAGKGFYCGYPQSEDWGWFLEYCAGEDCFWLCCSNTDNEGKAWRCFLRPKSKGFFSLKKAPVNFAEPLMGALRELLEETSAIQNIEWSHSCGT